MKPLEGPKQPVPHVGREDVVRVVRREFSGHNENEVLDILDEYGTERWHPEVPRVHLAILKLSAGSLDSLRKLVTTAKTDFRDVVAPAEYPQCWKHGGLHRMSDSEVNRIIEADWQQYCDWLKAT